MNSGKAVCGSRAYLWCTPWYGSLKLVNERKRPKWPVATTLRAAVCHDILEYSGRVLATSCRRSPAADDAAGHTVGYCVILSLLHGSARPDAHVARKFTAVYPALGYGHVQLTPTVARSQTLQVRFRLVSARAWRASWQAAASSSGTWFPVLKYISSGVCPRNAECGRRALCSCT